MTQLIQIQKVVAENDILRLQTGALKANGVSPAHWGFRVNDASGNPIFDSQGIIQPVAFLGTGSDVSPSTITATTPTVIPGMTVSFTLARPAYVFFSAIVNGITAGATGRFAYCEIDIDGAFAYQMGLFDKTGGAYASLSDQHFTESRLAAGSHTIDVRIYVDAGQTWTNWNSALYCNLVGG